jgi:hypothetical protein
VASNYAAQRAEVTKSIGLGPTSSVKLGSRSGINMFQVAVLADQPKLASAPLFLAKMTKKQAASRFGLNVIDL